MNPFNNIVTRIRLNTLFTICLTATYPLITYADNKRTKEQYIKIVDEIICHDKKITINNYKTINSPDGIENYKIGQYKNKWVAYDEAMHFGEHHSYIIINKNTCEKYVIDGVNIEFLNDDAFLTWSWDFEAEYYPNQISTYSIKNDAVIKTGEFIPVIGGPSKAKWIDENTIKLILVDFNRNDAGGKGPYTYQEKNIVRANGKWAYQ